MAKGDGQIKPIMKNGKQAKDSEGRAVWEIRISLGWNPVKKKYDIHTERFHGTKTAARKRRDELKREHENGIDIEASKTPLGEFADKWLSGRIESGELSENTITRYRGVVEQIKSYLAAVAVCDVSAMMVDDFLRTLKSERGISNTTLNKVYMVLNQIMEQAERYDMVLRNPCAKVKPPKNERAERRSLNADEAAKLLAEIGKAESEAYGAEQAKESRRRDDDTYERGYLRGITSISCALVARFGLATGCRRGEALALTWDNLDLRNGLVSIVASLMTNGKTKKPKTKSSVRTIALDGETVAALRKWRDFQSRELGKIGFDMKPDTPVFSDAKGGYINPNNFSRWWRAFVAGCGFDGLLFHSLRHSQASLLLANGVDVKTTMHRLGHSNASTTLNIYAHLQEGNDRAAADMLGSLLGESGKPRIVPFRKTA